MLRKPQSDEEAEAMVGDLPSGAFEVIDKAMEIFHLMEKNKAVSLGSLAQGFLLAISEGYDSAAISLFMLSRAVNMAKDEAEGMRNG